MRGSSRAAADRGRFLTISEAARILGVSPSSLRNWEKIGLITPIRSQGRYRLFSPEALKQAKQIRFLRRVKRLNPHGILHVLRTSEGAQGEKPAPPKKDENIGSRLARLRQQGGLTLTEAAQKAGISPSFLSAIERNQANPSVATFQKLAHLYKTNVLSFFGNEDGLRRLVRPRERGVLQPHPGVRIERLALGPTVMDAQLWYISPGASSGGSYHHEGEEFIYVLQGTVEIWLDEVERYVVEPGDSLYFESTHAHRWKNEGKTEAVLLWVNTPPTF